MSGFATTLDQNWLITGNTIGSTVAAEKMSYRGMLYGSTQNAIVSNNRILGVISGASSTSTMTGIQVAFSVSGGSISGNTISDIKQTNSGGWGSNGIYLGSASTTSNLTVANNVVYDVASYGYSSGWGAADNGYGIFVGTGGGYKLYYNTIRLTTNQTSAGNTAAINISSSITTAASLDLQDNIFANSQTNGTRYAIYCAAANTVFSTINYNDYWPGTGTLGYLGAAQATLALWQGATLQDGKSISADPLFVSTTNQQILTGSPVLGAATPAGGITTDITGATRSGSTPTIGAYEYPYVADLAVSQTDAFTTVATGSNATYTITVTNNGPSAAASPSLADTLPTDAAFVSFTPAAGWTCNPPSGGSISCTAASAMAPGASAVFQLVVKVNYCLGSLPSPVTSITNAAAVSSTTPDSNPANNSSSVITTVSDSGACDDGDACTSGDHCSAGACVTTGGCDDSNPCTSNECVLTPTPHCEFPPITCNTPPDVCHTAAGFCTYPGPGICEYPPAPDTTVCEDGDLCTLNDHCSGAGSCVSGTPKNCDDSTVCTTDTCTPATGACVHAAEPVGTACDDGDFCTTASACGPQVGFTQNFDGVTAPALPSGWTTAAASGNPWVTTTTTPDTAPNAAFSDDPASTSDKHLDSPPILISSPTAQLSFRNKWTFEGTSTCYDGGVLEIKIGAGSFTDIVTAGGSFVSGGYNGTTASYNPMGARPAWCFSSAYVTTVVNLPAAAAGQTIVLRWRTASDSSGSGTGQYIDSISITSGWACVGTANLDCNDTNACTADTCDPLVPGGCVHTNVPNGTACLDGDLCNGSEACAAGVCQPGTPLNCDDGNVCTTDTCGATTGCAHANNTNACDDGNECTGGDICGAPAICGATQDFDKVAAPALPTGWTSTLLSGTPGTDALWVTSTTYADTTPNSAFGDDPGTVTDKVLTSPPIAIVGTSAQLTFKTRWTFEGSTSCFDGGVLEIKIGAGSFTDIVTAGGSFVSGAYNGTVYTGYGNPLAGRAGWCFSQTTFLNVVVNLPASAAGQSIVLRWRVASDDSTGATGQYIDTINITDTCTASCAGTPLVAGTACGSSSTGACDNADTCNGAGVCLVNHVPDGTFCGDTGTECINQDTCLTGACQDNGFKPVGTGCGSPVSTTCDHPDTCDGSGACQTNWEPATTACTDGLACTLSDHCTGTGACVGTAKDCSDGNTCTADSCVEPGGTCEYAISGACDIVGNISYYREQSTATEPSTKPVAGVDVTRVSSFEPTATATTNASGVYTFTGEAGNITLTPSQIRLVATESECRAAITAADATEIAKASVSLVTLTPNQRIAADVSNNGAITSYDAGLTAQKAVAVSCIGYHFPVRNATGSDWAFRPVSRSFTPLVGGEDYSFLGVMYGDVTGNWAPPVFFGATADGADVSEPISAGSIQNPRQVRISEGAMLYLIGAPRQVGDGQWQYTLGLQNADGILGMDLTLRAAQGTTIQTVTAAGIASGFQLVSNSVDNDSMISMFGIDPMVGSGQFLVVTVKTTGGLSGMPFEVSAEANEGLIPVGHAPGVPGTNSTRTPSVDMNQ